MDRGYKQILLNPKWRESINAVFPSFITTHPIPTLDSNLGRLLGTLHRFISEKSIGHFKQEWMILVQRIIGPQKLYIDKIQDVLAAVNNFK